MKKWIALGGGLLALLALWAALFFNGSSSAPKVASETSPAEVPEPLAHAPLEPTEPTAARVDDEAASVAQAKPVPMPKPMPMPPSGHFDTMQRAFDAEAREAAWAREEEARIPKLLAEVGFPSAAYAGDVTCRRTLCRFQLVIGDDDSFALMKLGAKLQTSHGLGLAYGAAELVDGKSRVTVYTPREGTSRESVGIGAEARVP